MADFKTQHNSTIACKHQNTTGTSDKGVFGQNQGFLGINLHYLSMPMRMRLLDRLVDYSNNDKFDDTTQLLVDYARLKNVSLIKPCLKRYLASNVKTQFRKVTADEFVVATLLPVQKFKKQSDQHVFNKSRGMV